MTIEILKQDIKNKAIKKIYLFYGQEEYLKRFYIKNIENIILTEDQKCLNKIVFEDKIDENEIISILNTYPVFSDKKLIIIKNSSLFKSNKKGNEEKSGGMSERFLNILKDIPEYSCIIFNESEIDKRKKIVDIIKKSGLIVEFKYQKPQELINWIIKIFKSYKKEIGTVEASMILECCEQSMDDILAEVNKIDLYTKGKSKVSVDDVTSVCSKTIKSKIFDLTDAIIKKDSNKAFLILNDMMVLKEPMSKVLFMIARQFKQVLELKLYQREGYSLNEVASKIGLTPYIAEKILKHSKNISVKTLKNALNECINIDISIKSGLIKDKIAVELFIVKFVENS